MTGARSESRIGGEPGPVYFVYLRHFFFNRITESVYGSADVVIRGQILSGDFSHRSKSKRSNTTNGRVPRPFARVSEFGTLRNSDFYKKREMVTAIIIIVSSSSSCRAWEPNKQPDKEVQKDDGEPDTILESIQSRVWSFASRRIEISRKAQNIPARREPNSVATCRQKTRLESKSSRRCCC